jgi:hypothetical protein
MSNSLSLSLPPSMEPCVTSLLTTRNCPIAQASDQGTAKCEHANSVNSFSRVCTGLETKALWRQQTNPVHRPLLVMQLLWLTSWLYRWEKVELVLISCSFLKCKPHQTSFLDVPKKNLFHFDFRLGNWFFFFSPTGHYQQCRIPTTFQFLLWI